MPTKSEKQHANATQHETSSAAKLIAIFFLFHIFLSLLGKLREGCLHWNAAGFELFQIKYLGLNTSTPSSHNVTNTYILDGGEGVKKKKKKAQCTTTVGSDKAQN